MRRPWLESKAEAEREITRFAGERVVFVHCAGTLDPIGFAGEVDPERYARQVLLNSAAPQVLGDAFLRAARETPAPLGPSTEGWSAYGAGKAALDQWVRTAGAEQERRGGRVRLLVVAPGIVQTAMQEQIRATSPEDFPGVQRFREFAERGELRDPEDVARDLWSLLDRDLPNGAVVTCAISQRPLGRRHPRNPRTTPTRSASSRRSRPSAISVRAEPCRPRRGARSTP